MQQMPSVLVLFGFEYAILAVGCVTTMAKYLLHAIDMRIEGTWQVSGSAGIAHPRNTFPTNCISYVNLKTCANTNPCLTLFQTRN
jgi:hypothetical protein